jgi:hypothetical protein
MADMKKERMQRGRAEKVKTDPLGRAAMRR